MISEKDTKHIAKLARLGLKDKELKKLQKELSLILDYVDVLKRADISKSKVFSDLREPFFSKDLREDKPETDEIADKLISLAPDKKSRHIKVKSIF